MPEITINPTLPANHDAAPTDPDRTRVVSPGATHVVTANGVGGYCRGDKIGANDLETGQAGIARLIGLNAIRPLTEAEKAGVPPLPKPEPAKPAK